MFELTTKWFHLLHPQFSLYSTQNNFATIRFKMQFAPSYLFVHISSQTSERSKFIDVFVGRIETWNAARCNGVCCLLNMLLAVARGKSQSCSADRKLAGER